jgi:xanthine dehydrogenase YagT iron-sulfur-binding subunit
MAKSHQDDKPEKQGLSRRAFLSTSAGIALSTPMIGDAAIADQAAAEVFGPGKVPIVLRVNGKSHNLSLEPRVTLLEALHNYLDYTGAKKVCDRATCGACTVIMGGAPVYACSVLAIEAQGKDITTVEGLSTGGKLHPLQAAFIEHDAQQCGFCTPGFVVACKAFLDKNPNPTLEGIEKGLGGNLCRCGTYVGIRQAVLTAAQAMKGGRNNG